MHALPPSVGYTLRRVARSLGSTPLALYRAGIVTPENVRARVRWMSAVELANAIEAYPIIVTLDASLLTSAPAKGDEFLIEGARRAVMSVREIHAGTVLVAYQCGVQG